MAPQRLQYTLVGFSQELDWRPLNFIKPIPRNRVCCGCGLVRKRTALFPCSHALCEVCFARCKKNGVLVCPLDDLLCEDDDIDWRDFASEDLLNRKVNCWNKESDCRAVMTASEIVRHFRSECEHHSVSCPNCSYKVSCNDVVLHLRSESCSAMAPLALEDEEKPPAKDEAEVLASLKAGLEKQVAEVKSLLQRIISDMSAHDDRFNETLESMQSFKACQDEKVATIVRENVRILQEKMGHLTVSNEELKECLNTQSDKINVLPSMIEGLENAVRADLDKATDATRAHMSQISADIKSAVEENNERTRKATEEVQLHAELQVAVTTFLVSGVEELKQKALNEGWSLYEAQKTYLCGYCISPGVYIKKDGQTLNLYAWLRLYKGCIDHRVQWPFQRKICLSVVSPRDCSKRGFQVQAIYSAKYFKKPTEVKNECCFFSAKFLSLNDLSSEGYVENNSFLVIWELLPLEALK